MSLTFEEMAKLTEADKAEFKGHSVFQELDKAIDFYDSFDFSVMGFSTLGTRSIINLDSFVYSSIGGTLESIKAILQNGRIGDAFCLLRKYHDSCILNLYTNVYLERNRDAGKALVEEVIQWMNNGAKLPHNDFRAMLPYLQKEGKSKEILDLILQDTGYKETRARCNDHTHYNSLDSVLINDNKMRLDRVNLLNLFQKDLENIFILHVASILHINNHYMMSSDYLDALELGLTPEKDSQYWVANFVQVVFSETISTKRADVAELIKKNTSMQLS